MKFKLALSAVSLGLSLPAVAAPGNNFIDGYYVPWAQVEITNAGPFDANEEGDGFGVKGALEFAPDVFITGEFQNNQYDDNGGEAELETYRLGLGFGHGAGTGGGLYCRLEYINADDPNDDSADESGGVGTLGFALPLSEELRLHAEAGYQKFDDADGPEFLVGITLQLAPNVGLFADYRNTQLELEDTNIEIQYDEARIGARFYF